jgi:hypothetical protein
MPNVGMHDQPENQNRRINKHKELGGPKDDHSEYRDNHRGDGNTDSPSDCGGLSYGIARGEKRF